MDREGFLETIRRQYAEDIQEAYLESEHEGGEVDYGALRDRLGKLMRNAKVDGLPHKDFQDLVLSTLPQVEGKLDWSSLGSGGSGGAKKAA
jgi:hypothetical protein